MREMPNNRSEFTFAKLHSPELEKRFNELPQYYKHLRKEILEAVPSDAINILDVGCGAGVLGKALKEQNPDRKVTGIELNSEAYFFANLYLDRAYNVDVELFSLSEAEFDCIIFADIIEHLRDPWATVKRVMKSLKPGGTVIISIPNIRNLDIIRNLVEGGKWTYTDEGILDKTHLRFFTKLEFLNFLREMRISCQEIHYLGNEVHRRSFDGKLVTNLRLGRLEFHDVTQDELEELTAVQILFKGIFDPAGTLDHTRCENGLKNKGVPDGSFKQPGVPGSVQNAEQLIQSARYAEAEAVLSELISSYPLNIDALNDMAVVKILQNKFEDAFDLLKKVISIDPENKIATENIQIILNKVNQVYYDLKNDINNHNYGVKNLSDEIVKAEQLIEKKAYDEAEVILNKVISSFPFNLDALNDLAVVYILQGKKDKALEKLKIILEIDPNNEIANENVRSIERIVEDNLIGNQKKDETLKTGLLESDQLPLVSIIIPVYNKLEFTRKCLTAIEANTEYPNYEIILINNGSTDGTRQYLDHLMENNQRVKAIHSTENVGFVKGCNTAAENAKGKYVLFLNNDTEVQKGWLRSLVEFAETHEDCGAVGSKLVYPDGTLQEAGAIIFSDGNGWNFGRGGDPDDPSFNYVREVDYCSGASLMVRTDLWRKIGGFDLRYAPAYYEDSDLCFEIRKLGYKVYYNYKSVVIHHEGKTSGTTLTEGFKRYQLINRSKFVAKWNTELQKQYKNNPANVEAASKRESHGNVLVFDDILPMPDRAAGSKFCYNIVDTLRNLKYHVTFISVSTHLKDLYEDGLRQNGVETYCGDPQALNAILGTNYTMPYNYKVLLSRKKYDFAFINFWHIAEYYIPVIRKYSPETKIIVVSHDIHFNREFREAAVKNDVNLINKAENTKIREIKAYEDSDLVWVVSESERNLLSRYINPSKIQVVPLVEEHQVTGPAFDKRHDLVFVGNFNHRPNVDGIQWFVRDVLPLVWSRLPEIKLFVIGNNPPPEVISLKSEKIIVTGYVKDLSAYLNRARVSVAPLRYGGGVKGKILEAMGAGLPVVTTQIGLEGIDAVDGEHLVVADDPVQFAERIVSLYTDKEVWLKLSESGSRLVRERYSIGRLREGIQHSIKVLQRPEYSNSKTTGNISKLTSIVIVTYNNQKYTMECVSSIQRYTKIPYELIFIDNASHDGSRGYLKKLSKQMKNVKLVFNTENKGFPFACNQGIAIASGEYVLLLNSDVVVTEKWLEGLIKRAESDNSIGIVGPMTNRISGYQMERSAIYSSQIELKKYAAKYRKDNMNKWMEVRRVAGFCMLIKREVIDRIGGLDPLFGIGNCEDDDYCLRAAIAGYRTVIAQDVFIHHYGGGSFLANGMEKYIDILERNSAIFTEKWGVSPTEWWRNGRDVTKSPALYVPLPDLKIESHEHVEDEANSLVK